MLLIQPPSKADNRSRSLSSPKAAAAKSSRDSSRRPAGSALVGRTESIFTAWTHQRSVDGQAAAPPPRVPVAKPDAKALSPAAPQSLGDARPSLYVPSLVDKLTADWHHSDPPPPIEDYLRCLDPTDAQGAIELIYREFCLAEAAGWEPDPTAYLARYPRYSEQLGRLLQLHGVCSPSLIDRWIGSTPEYYSLPEAGDSIGPYVLRRELGRGSFARVFLAEQADLENRLVVAKVSTRITREPWLLAKSSHAHIVDVLCHAEVDDGAIHLICMPFWGGATLGAVLEHRRTQAFTPRSGIDFLADLDAVAAPEYPTVHPARPAREILRSLSYTAALAWVTARLAEALSHAFSRGVSHGDVKPSNILLAADGSPMLLDFNLAHETAPGQHGDKSCGGTIAYMSPERLLALAAMVRDNLDERSLEAAQSPRAASQDASSNFLMASSLPPPDLDRQGQFASAVSTTKFPSAVDLSHHRGDIYSLGMVLLEGLTGRSPEGTDLSDDDAGDSGSDRFERSASAYAAARSRPIATMIRAFESGRGRSVEPGLRSILERCLDPNPDLRYANSAELADDLDRWRTGRRLAFAPEPFVKVTIPRWFYARRRSLAAAALALAVLIGTSTVGLFQLRDVNLTFGLLKVSGFWDFLESGSFHFQRPYAQELFDPVDSETIETAGRVLKEYDVFESADWRQRNDVRCLPAFEREELELWVCEQAFRFARVLASRPDSPDDWKRAFIILDKAATHRPILAFQPLKDVLELKLGQTSARASKTNPVATTETAPPWLEKFLLGVASETESRFARPIYADPKNATSTQGLRIATQTALEHYSSMLDLRPDSFWGHYRAAVAAHALDQPANAVIHLQVCLQKRPKNPIIRGQLAGCLTLLQDFDEALRQCDLAIAGAPDFAEFYRSRAFIKTGMGQSTGLAEDIRSFEHRAGILPRSFLGDSLFTLNEPRSTEFTRRQDHATPINRLPHSGRSIDEKEIDARSNLAKAIRINVGDFNLAQSEINKVLLLDSDNLMALAFRATQAAEEADFDSARRDLECLFSHADLYDYAHRHPNLVSQLLKISSHGLHRNRTDFAELIACKAREISRQLKERGNPSPHVGWSHYHLARVYAVLGVSSREALEKCPDELFRAIRANQDFRAYFMRDHYFNAVRPAVLADLNRIEDAANKEKAALERLPQLPRTQPMLISDNRDRDFLSRSAP